MSWRKEQNKLAKLVLLWAEKTFPDMEIENSSYNSNVFHLWDCKRDYRRTIVCYSYRAKCDINKEPTRVSVFFGKEPSITPYTLRLNPEEPNFFNRIREFFKL